MPIVTGNGGRAAFGGLDPCDRAAGAKSKEEIIPGDRSP
jgi:hypothetical protein